MRTASEAGGPRSTIIDKNESTLMDPTTIVHLSIALAAIVAAIICFNVLSGKGPRGTVWFVAASVLTWAVILPIVLRNPDDLSLSREMDLLVVVLQLCAAIGAILGILDVLQQRRAERRHAVADWAVRQPLLWGVVVGAWFYALLYQGVIDSPSLWRYMAGHWVEVVEGAFFFVGMAVLVLRLVEIAGQRKSAALITLGCVPLGGQRVEDCEGLVSQLENLPARIQQSYLARGCAKPSNSCAAKAPPIRSMRTCGTSKSWTPSRCTPHTQRCGSSFGRFRSLVFWAR